jgi:integrase
VGAVESVPEIKNPSAKQLAEIGHICDHWIVTSRGAFLWALAVEGEARALRIYIALFETWMRKGALAAMTPRWVNFAQERIRIPSAYTKAQRGDLEIDLTPRAAEAIRAELGDVVYPDKPIFGAFDYRALFPHTEVAGIDLEGPDRPPRHPQDRRDAGRREARSLAGGAEGSGRMEDFSVGRGFVHEAERRGGEEGDAVSSGRLRRMAA